jgi:hypothetical protein
MLGPRHLKVSTAARGAAPPSPHRAPTTRPRPQQGPATYSAPYSATANGGNAPVRASCPYQCALDLGVRVNVA